MYSFGLPRFGVQKDKEPYDHPCQVLRQGYWYDSTPYN
jgi:hypothetical protein